MYDAPDNQVVYLPCILHFMQTKPHMMLSRDASCTSRNFDLFFTDDMYVRIDLLNLFFNAPRTCCCWWLCLEVKKRQKTVRTRGFVRFINTVHRRETVEKQRFRSCPEKKRENRTKPRFCTVYSYGAPWRKNGVVRFSLRRVEPHRRKNRSTGNRAEPHRTIYHSTEPHRRIYDIWKPHRTAP